MQTKSMDILILIDRIGVLKDHTIFPSLIALSGSLYVIHCFGSLKDDEDEFCWGMLFEDWFVARPTTSGHGRHHGPKAGAKPIDHLGPDSADFLWIFCGFLADLLWIFGRFSADFLRIFCGFSADFCGFRGIFGDPDGEIQTTRSYPVETLLTKWGPCQLCGDPSNPLGTLPTLWRPHQPPGDTANPWGPHQPHSNPVITPPTPWRPHQPCGDPVGTLPTPWEPHQPHDDPINPMMTPSTPWWPHQPISA